MKRVAICEANLDRRVTLSLSAFSRGGYIVDNGFMIDDVLCICTFAGIGDTMSSLFVMSRIDRCACAYKIRGMMGGLHIVMQFYP